MQIQKFDRITVNPAILHGQPTIRGMRLSVRRVLEAFSMDPDWGNLQADYPELEREDIRQALAYAAVSLNDEILPLEAA
jgi:uncharacterized protein (DUF433 family)